LFFAVLFASIYGATRALAHYLLPFERLPEGFEIIPPGQAMAGIALVTFAVVWGWLVLEAITRMDPRRIATQNLGWSVRHLVRRETIVPAAVYYASVAGAFWLFVPSSRGTIVHWQTIFYALLAIAVLWFLVIPLTISQPPVVESSARRPWPRFGLPRLPSFSTLYAAFQLSAATLALRLLGAGLESIVTDLAVESSRWGLWVEYALVGQIVGFITLPCLSAIAAALLFRTSSRPAFRRWLSYYRWRRFGPLVALQARFVICEILVTAVVLSTWFLQDKIIPAATSMHTGKGFPFSFEVRVGIETVQRIQSWAPLILLPFLWIFIWLSAARFAWEAEKLPDSLTQDE